MDDSNTPVDKAKFYIERGGLKPENDFAVICQALIDSEPKQASGITNQVIIYAKNWYGKTDDPIADLKEIICKCCELKPEHVSDADVKMSIIRAFEKYAREYDRIEALERGLGLNSIDILNYNIYKGMLGKLSIILGKYVNMDEKLDMSFNKQFVIYSKDEDGYWSNQYGWVDEVNEEDESMVYSYQERRNCNVPREGEWVEYIPTGVMYEEVPSI